MFIYEIKLNNFLLLLLNVCSSLIVLVEVHNKNDDTIVNNETIKNKW